MPTIYAAAPTSTKMVEIRSLELLPEVKEIVPRRLLDDRGYFAELWRDGWLQPGWNGVFVQHNQSFSSHQGTLRGLHLQLAPSAQAKLVRVVRGSIFDVAVDLRPESLTFSQWACAELSAVDGNQLFIPEGFAHGFMTLEDDCEVAYQVSAFYDPLSERSVRWDDPALAIAWPALGVEPKVSLRDASAPLLSEICHEL